MKALESLRGYRYGIAHPANACLVVVEHYMPFISADCKLAHVLEFVPVWPHLKDQLRLAINRTDETALSNLYDFSTQHVTEYSEIIGTTGWTENDAFQIDPIPLFHGGREYVRINFGEGHAVVRLGEFTLTLLKRYQGYCFVMDKEHLNPPIITAEEKYLNSTERNAVLSAWFTLENRFGQSYVLTASFKDLVLTNVDDQDQSPLAMVPLLDQFDYNGETLYAAKLVIALRRLLMREPEALAAWGLFNVELKTTDKLVNAVVVDDQRKVDGYIIRANSHRWATLRSNSRALPADHELLDKDKLISYLKGHALTVLANDRLNELVVPKEFCAATIRHNLAQETKSFIIAA